ncbi:hypothetical protein MTO96_047670 [Rhipicephalus appendiculatus]
MVTEEMDALSLPLRSVQPGLVLHSGSIDRYWLFEGGNVVDDDGDARSKLSRSSVCVVTAGGDGDGAFRRTVPSHLQTPSWSSLSSSKGPDSCGCG